MVSRVEASPASPCIRLATIEDLDRVVAIERAAHAKPWSLTFFTQELSHSGRSFTLLISPSPVDDPVSLLHFLIDHDEARVINLATHPEHRCQGYASSLLEDLFERAPSQGVKYVMLEVRRSNDRALRLYRRTGFQRIGVRPMYYSDGDEDALVMVHRIT